MPSPEVASWSPRVASQQKGTMEKALYKRVIQRPPPEFVEEVSPVEVVVTEEVNGIGVFCVQGVTCEVVRWYRYHHHRNEAIEFAVKDAQRDTVVQRMVADMNKQISDGIVPPVDQTAET